jgi:hypothetical protein
VLFAYLGHGLHPLNDCSDLITFIFGAQELQGKNMEELGMVVHICNPSIQEAEAGR